MTVPSRQADEALDRLIDYAGWATTPKPHKDAVATVRDELGRLREERDALREALTAVRDCAKWYGEGERLPHEVHHALVVEVYAVADMALAEGRPERETPLDAPTDGGGA